MWWRERASQYHIRKCGGLKHRHSARLHLMLPCLVKPEAIQSKRVVNEGKVIYGLCGIRCAYSKVQSVS